MADTIIPEDKDWTWVLDTPCGECGFDSATMQGADVGTMIRSNAASFAAILSGPPAALRARPDDQTWSVLEYGAHVRDVYRLFAERLALMLTADDPLFSNWNQDETAVADDYRSQDPQIVAQQLLRAADRLADDFDRIDGDTWTRTGRRSDGAAFTIDTFARYLIHDPIHHLHDVDG